MDSKVKYLTEYTQKGVDYSTKAYSEYIKYGKLYVM